MRQLLASLLGGLALATCQGTYILYPTGLYRTAADFRQHRPTLAGTGTDRVFLAREACVKTGPGQRRRVPLDSLWGYAGIDRLAYRVYRHRAYQVEQADTLTIYSVLSGAGKTSHRSYYFSRGLDGPVESLTRRQLRRAYADNPRFLALLDALKWYQPLSAPVALPGGSRPYRAVALYRQALGLPAARGR